MEEKISISDDKKQTVILERLDISFGELANMYKDGDLVIRPSYQRLFRWDREKQTVFIESILLGLPLPSIFVYADEDNKYELLDGLQRISTILAFVGELSSDSSKNNFKLVAPPILKELEGCSFNDLDDKHQREIKRRYIRVDIIGSGSNESAKYEFFKRVNSNSEPLSDQEMRNCVFHCEYNNGIVKLASEITKENKFDLLLDLTQKQKNEMFIEELILRYYTFCKNGMERLGELINDKAFSEKNILDEFMKIQQKEGLSLIPDSFLEKINWFGNLYTDSKEDQKKLKNIFRHPSNGQFTLGLYDVLMIGLESFWYEIKVNTTVNWKEAISEFKKKDGTWMEQYNTISEVERKRLFPRIELGKKFFGSKLEL